MWIYVYRYMRLYICMFGGTYNVRGEVNVSPKATLAHPLLGPEFSQVPHVTWDAGMMRQPSSGERLCVMYPAHTGHLG